LTHPALATGSTRVGSLTARCVFRACEVPVLSITEARCLLGADCPMTDQEIEAMLDQVRQIAFITLDTVEADRHRAAPELDVCEP